MTAQQPVFDSTTIDRFMEDAAVWCRIAGRDALCGYDTKAILKDIQRAERLINMAKIELGIE